MKLAHTRFTMVRANIVLAGLVSHSAKTTRRSSGESIAMLFPSSGVGGRGRARRGCMMSPETLAKTMLSPMVAVLDAHAREQVGHLVILLLRPLFERMVVAAGARDALAHEGQRGIFGKVDGVFVQDEIVQRAVLAGAAGAQEDLAGELVPGLVLLSPLRESSRRRPTWQSSSGGGSTPAAGRTICRPSNRRIRRDAISRRQLRALVWRGVGEEALHFFGGGQNAGGIEIGAAQERGIVGDFRRRQVEALRAWR